MTVITVLGICAAETANSQTNVLTQHNDVGRTGLNHAETVLTPANVNASLFGKLYSIPIDGQAYAQPLYMSSLAIDGVHHSVLFVATEHDSVFAFDTNAHGAVLWHASMTSTTHGAAAGATTDPENNTSGVDIQGNEYGIMATPVIDPTTNTLYTTARTREKGLVIWRLHALDLTTGSEKFGGPMVITGSVAGKAPDAVNGMVNFDPKWHNQRPGLLLLNGVVYVAFGSIGDLSSFHGWIMGYSAASGTLHQTTVFVDTPNGSEGGIWMTGMGLAADTENGVSRVFFSTGNGSYDAAPPYGTNTMDYSDDILAMTQNSSGGLEMTDEFTPFDQYLLDRQDMDVSSGGIVVLPDNLPGSSHPHLLVQLGKAGVLLLANRDNLGGYSTTTDNDLQEIQTPHGIWGSPAYWNGNVYFWPSNSSLQQYSLSKGALLTSPTAQGPIIETGKNGHPFTGATVSVSSNGDTNPIVWADDYVTYGGWPIQYLQAYDGTDVAHLLWSSAQFPERNGAGASQKWAMPTIVDGKVYVASQGYIEVYGLVPPDFDISAAQSLVSIPATSSAKVPITVNSFGGFTGSVALKVSGLPSGVTASIDNEVLTLSASATAPATPTGATLMVTGTSGSMTHSISIVLDVLTASSGPLINTPLDLSAYYNVNAIETDGGSGSYQWSGGLDGQRYALAESQVGNIVIYDGVPYSFGPANLPDGITSRTISIPAAAGTVGPFKFLATGTGTTDESFVLNYTDGSSSTLTQSLSDWGSPQNYAGESKALSTAYRVMPSGADQDGPWYVYQYSAPLTPGKVLSSVRLPDNRAIVMLAATLPTLGTAQSITFKSIATTTAEQAIGSQIALTATDSSGLSVVYTSSTPKVCTVSGSNATVVGAGTCTITASQAGNSSYAAAPPVSQSFAVSTGFLPVSLTSVYNVDGIANNGSAPAKGGLDGSSYAYSENLLGASLTALNIPFTLGSAGVADAVSDTTIPIPSGSFAALHLLATSVLGNQATATFVLNFTDGTTSKFVQGINNWGEPQSYSGETTGLRMAYRVTPTGKTETGPWYVFAYAIPIPSGKTLRSLTLPATRSVVVLAATLSTLPATPTFSVSSGTYTSTRTVALSDATAGASIYYTTDGKTPTTGSTRYSAPLSVNGNETISAVAVTTDSYSSAVAVASYSIVPQPSGSAVVNLSSAFNEYAIFDNGSAPTHGGLDGSRYAYAGATLPTVIALAGVPLTLGPIAGPNAVSNKTVSLAPGKYGGIILLASATYGPMLNQPFKVTYTDATTTTFTQNMSDWGHPNGYAGETNAISDPYRIGPQGIPQTGPWFIYGYNFPLNMTKTVAGITLPVTADVNVYAIALTADAITPQTITFRSIASQKVGTTLAMTATATSDAAVTFSSSTTGVCTESGGTASFHAAGTCSITATQAGSHIYAPASATQSFSVY